MPSENIPTKEAEMAVWFTNFAEVALANATVLGLTTAQTTQLTTFAGLFSTKYADAVAARNASKSATAEKDGILAGTLSVFGGTAKMILADPEVTPALKSLLGMNPGVTPKAPLSAPTDLAATAYSTGRNALVWKRGVNSKSVTFVIEAKFGASPNWLMIGQTQSVKFNDTGRTPGEMITYRVFAERGKSKSDFSNQAVVYSASEGETVFLKQAA